MGFVQIYSDLLLIIIIRTQVKFEWKARRSVDELAALRPSRPFACEISLNHWIVNVASSRHCFWHSLHEEVDVS